MKLSKFKRNPKKYQGGYIGIATLILSAVGTEVARENANAAAGDVANANRQALEAKQRSEQVIAQRERIKQIREANIQRARIIQQSATEGLGPSSSGVVGATGSITSQESANIGSINVAQGFAQQASMASQRAADAGTRLSNAQTTAQRWQTIGNFGNSIFQAKGGWENLLGDTSVKKVQ